MDEQRLSSSGSKRDLLVRGKNICNNQEKEIGSSPHYKYLNFIVSYWDRVTAKIFT